MDSISDFHNFPAYTDFSPDVPAWCVTPGEGRCIHRYFDTSPFSPSGRYLAVFRMPYEDHPPCPGDPGDIIVIDYDGSGLHKMFDPSLGSGHPMVHPSRKFLTTDVYMWEPQCLPDGTSYLRLIDLQDFHETDFLRIGVTPPGEAPRNYIELRLDPHPAWDRTGRYLAFNGIFGGTRRVFIADMAKFLS